MQIFAMILIAGESVRSGVFEFIMNGFIWIMNIIQIIAILVFSISRVENFRGMVLRMDCVSLKSSGSP